MGLSSRDIVLDAIIDEFGLIVSAFTLPDEIVVSTRTSPNRILSYSWNCQPASADPTNSTDLASLGFLRKSDEDKSSDTESQLVSVWSDKSSELFVWCVGRTRRDSEANATETQMEAFFVQRRRRSGDKTKFTWNGIVLPATLSSHGPDQAAESITAAAVNTRHLLVALGTTHGRVMVFSISDTGKRSSLSHCVGEVRAPGAPESSGSAASRPKRGAVHDLDFSSDGLCIACAFQPLPDSKGGSKGGGLGIWSIYGRWLAGTVGGPEDFETTYRKADLSAQQNGVEPTSLEEDGIWMRGVQSLFWGLGSYELFLLPSVPMFDSTSDRIHHALDESVTDIYVVPLANLPIGGCPSLVATQHMYLQTDDRLLIHTTALNSSIRSRKTDARGLETDGTRSRDAPSPLLGLGVAFGSVVDLGHPDSSTPSISQRGMLLHGGLDTPEHPHHRGVRNQDDTSIQVSLDPEMAQWFSIQIPSAYITSNWPIKYSAPSPNMDYISIAGRRGFAIYVIRQNRWRLFGNEIQEASFAVKGGLLWWEPSEFAVASSIRETAPVAPGWNNGPILIVPCSDLGANETKLRFFQPTANLDLRTALATLSLAKGIISMDLRDDTLLVYSADNVVRVYALELGIRPSVDVKLHHQFSLATCIPFPATVQSVFWLPAAKTLFSYYTPAILQQQPIVILNHGKLYILAPSGTANELPQRSLSVNDSISQPTRSAASGSATPVPSTFPLFGSVNSVAPELAAPAAASVPFLQLADGVEFVYLTSANERLGNYLSSKLWSSGGTKVKAWFNFGISLPTPEEEAALAGDFYKQAIVQALGGTERPTLDFPVEFFPLTIAVHKGIVTGLSQHMSLRSSYDVASYKVQTETNLWLPKLLRFLLANGWVLVAFLDLVSPSG